jgi:peptidoglycan biosynthesis protein MviN/MurJ (putative lipid II flippase)
MLGATVLLTLVTLTGLAAGFAREWLLVASWGAGARTDGFLVAMFLPEALRAVLAAGVLSSAGLSLWQGRPSGERLPWLGALTAGLMLLALALAALLMLGAPLWVRLIGPGLDATQRETASAALALLAWSVPGTVLQALWTVPLQAHGRFLLAGAGSLLYNGPAIAWLGWRRAAATEAELAGCFVLGSVLMAVVMLPSLWRHGWRPGQLALRAAPLRELGGRLWPLLTSAGLGQGIALLERIVCSYLGDGTLTVLNLARKLINLPLVALMSLNQVLLGVMSARAGHERLALLRRGMATVTLLTLPAAIGLMLGAHGVVALLFPSVPGTGPLPQLLAWYAVAMVVASWNSTLARYSYADGDTRAPLAWEAAGSALQALSLPLLAWWLGALGIVLATLAGTVLTGWLLMRANGLWQPLRLAPQVAASALALALCAAALPALPAGSPLQELVQASAAALLALLAFAAWLRPWRLT